MKYFVFLLLLISPYLLADMYCFELTEQATDFDENKQVRGQFKYVITSDMEIVRTEIPTLPESPKDDKMPDRRIDWSFQLKSFSFDHEKTGTIHSFDPDTLQAFKAVGQKIKGRNETVYLSDSGLITHNIGSLKLQGKNWQDYEVNLKKSMEEGKLKWTDVYAAARLISPMIVCFKIDETVTVGDIIDVPVSRSLIEKSHTVADVAKIRFIITERKESLITLESHNTRGIPVGEEGQGDISEPKDKFVIQTYVQMAFDLNEQMPVKMTHNRFTKMRVSTDFAQTVNSNFVIYKKN